ncbi:MAG: hypothetical protein ACYTEQ_12285 [Planctomycetota bacterium]|jgi:hypothetical protein
MSVDEEISQATGLSIPLAKKAREAIEACEPNPWVKSYILEIDPRNARPYENVAWHIQEPRGEWWPRS